MLVGQNLVRDPVEPEWLQQIWFAGCHSDVGGSYAEDESRLSDIALDWMVEEATSLPHPLVVEPSKLYLFPDSAGMQHSEVEAVRDSYPSWMPRRFCFSWAENPRKEARGAPFHPTVAARFELPTVSYAGDMRPYRPETLREDDRFSHLY